MELVCNGQKMVVLGMHDQAASHHSRMLHYSSTFMSQRRPMKSPARHSRHQDRRLSNYVASSHLSSTAFIAVGSNVGHRISNIDNACTSLDQAGVSIRRTSLLYETAPMYVQNQPVFVNGVLEVGNCLMLH